LFNLLGLGFALDWGRLRIKKKDNNKDEWMNVKIKEKESITLKFQIQTYFGKNVQSFMHNKKKWVLQLMRCKNSIFESQYTY
jgi:hypothetical protein